MSLSCSCLKVATFAVRALFSASKAEQRCLSCRISSSWASTAAVTRRVVSSAAFISMNFSSSACLAFSASNAMVIAFWCPTEALSSMALRSFLWSWSSASRRCSAAPRSSSRDFLCCSNLEFAASRSACIASRCSSAALKATRCVARSFSILDLSASSSCSSLLFTASSSALIADTAPGGSARTEAASTLRCDGETGASSVPAPPVDTRAEGEVGSDRRLPRLRRSAPRSTGGASLNSAGSAEMTTSHCSCRFAFGTAELARERLLGHSTRVPEATASSVQSSGSSRASTAPDRKSQILAELIVATCCICSWTP
mmetsp:Transcript_46211/g.100429  ORF Transcript_46211/g.100429 Transcript_46211/m.100429 type:complete len:314 (-) Transcript_46211:481-1422(-)